MTLPPDLLTVAQAAERLGISEVTAYRLVAQGEMPGAVRVGGQWRVSKPRLERHLHGDPFAPRGSVTGDSATPDAAPLAPGSAGANP